MTQLKFSNGIRFQTEPSDRQEGRILVASGTQSRNRDYRTGKPYRLVPSGMRYGAWGKTGLVLYMHNFNIPLGKSNLFLEEGKLWAPDSIDFHRRVVPIATQNWIGDAIGEFNTSVIADLWEEQYLNSVSIHIMFTREDEENVVETDEEILIPTSEVIEFSVVTVPGDREANRERMLAMGVDPQLAECLVSCDSGLDDGIQTIPREIVLPDGNRVSVSAQTEYNSVHQIPTLEVSAMEPEEQDLETTDLADMVVDEPTFEEEVETTLEVVEEFEDIPIVEVAQALADDEEALMVLAEAFAGNPAVIAKFAEAIQENLHILQGQVLETSPQPRIRFISNRKTVPVAQEAAVDQPAVEPVPRMTAVQQRTGRSKKHSKMLSMVR